MESKEHLRLIENNHDTAIWHRWGPYLSERQWGTVREDYSPDGAAWDYFTHDQSRSRAYRWGEDGIAGYCDRRGLLCFALALWNGKDPILKERIYGLTNSEANHGEDVKEYYYYLDATPTHSYLKSLYKYPQSEFPYSQLISENKKRGGFDPEYELTDTGIFDENHYFDVFVEYAKGDPNDTLIQITIHNRGPKEAEITVLPQLWYRNTWSWEKDSRRPIIETYGKDSLKTKFDRYGDFYLHFEGGEEFLFTENDTNNKKLFNSLNPTNYVKDAFHEYIVHKNQHAVNPDQMGTKATRVHRLTIPAGGSHVIKLRLTPHEDKKNFNHDFDILFKERKIEADEFYNTVTPGITGDTGIIQRQAFAGMIWSKQFFHYGVREWLEGDPTMPKPPEHRKKTRNASWGHFHAAEVLSMPDKWEYPWFAAWDLAFHTIPLAMVDPKFAKEQLILLLREWYMHPNGQIPAYEWSFDDVNPPVHAWAALRVYKIEKRLTGKEDFDFLARVFQKLMLNFTWWVNRKDSAGNNVFEGGFLGLDNIGAFDRNMKLPEGMRLEQSDATTWMAMFSLNMLAIALELAKYDPTYEDTASKFFEHFLYIAQAMNNRGAGSVNLWDDEDEFYYDLLKLNENEYKHVKVRSLVGLMPLLAVTTLEPEVLTKFPKFKRRMDWFLEHRPDLTGNVDFNYKKEGSHQILLSLVPRKRVLPLIRRMLDEKEFFSDYGIRAISQQHRDHPYTVEIGGVKHTVQYEPGESTNGMFGGNSNWRGPIWFPINFILLESLQKFDYYFKNDFLVECPTGSGQMMNLWQVSIEIEKRLRAIFVKNDQGHRPAFGNNQKMQNDPHWQDCVLFYEYFHGDNGSGIGASHQTGWTGLIAKVIDQLHQAESNDKTTTGKSERKSEKK